MQLEESEISIGNYVLNKEDIATTGRSCLGVLSILNVTANHIQRVNLIVAF
jgi:hypothetical protein